MAVTSRDLAIRFEPDGFVVAEQNVMGRQAAGNAFLRAAIAARGEGRLLGYSASGESGRAFVNLVRSIDPDAIAKWIPADRLDLLASAGTLYWPGPGLRWAARLRLRQGVSAYSLCGVTHTTATHHAMEAISAHRLDPLMPWDALVCTSSAVAETVRIHRQEEAEYIRWRLGKTEPMELPQTPVIPLGVHTSDFGIDEEERRLARASLGIPDNEIVILFVGRLSFKEKAHPDAMYLALEECARRTGNRLALLQCGWFADDETEAAFNARAAAASNVIRTIITDGRDADERRRSWAAAHIFMSLSDNIQETFGLTPLEAMAAGLPVIVTDWNGYKDTVQDGVEGFRIPTTMPPPGSGPRLALQYEAGSLSYLNYCGLASSMVSVDLDVLTQKLQLLLSNADLRFKMGAAGKRRATSEFEWSVIYERYRELWDELAGIRQKAASSPRWQKKLSAAPTEHPSRLDPLASFQHYPTYSMGADSIVTAVHRVDGRRYEALIADPLFESSAKLVVPPEIIAAILAAVAQPTSLERLARITKAPTARTIYSVSVLAKMGLVTVRPTTPS